MGRVGNSPASASPAKGAPGTRATLRSIRALPSLEPLSTAGVELVVRAIPDELELILSKLGWKSPASAHIPTRLLRVGTQVRARAMGPPGAARPPTHPLDARRAHATPPFFLSHGGPQAVTLRI